ncbi:uncharacterized protein N7469_009731 [Penicillium citrinum]|uniref:Extracellular serine-rich protein n=1 Tax=Penicillium citrinum TaxID=5077 RepID=A0A9W9NIY9_PENCI|nr:uncharacterized protein N7469_009731 [Penicillium citrinum]KAJ5220844.1 hypothetical protein N7469_009731 [Penicillium citrinum]
MLSFLVAIFSLGGALASTLELGEKTSIEIDAGALIHQVTVGEDNSLLFAPNRLNANIGDRINFSFHGRNHTLTQSSLENPCSPLPQFDTGFGQFNPQGRSDISVTLTVNTLEPQWFFCKQNGPLSHCHAGMVFAINPGDKMERFEQNARRALSSARLVSSSSTFAGSLSHSKSSSRPTGVKITPVAPVAEITTVPTSLTGQTDSSAPKVVVYTKTVTKECSSNRPSSLATSTPSSAQKRNASMISAASVKPRSRIGFNLYSLVLGILLFQLR